MNAVPAAGLRQLLAAINEKGGGLPGPLLTQICLLAGDLKAGGATDHYTLHALETLIDRIKDTRRAQGEAA